MKTKTTLYFSVWSCVLVSFVLFGCSGSYRSIRPSEQKEIMKGNEGDQLEKQAPYQGASEKESLVELEIAIPGFPNWRRYYWTDKALWGNRGYVIGGPSAKYVVAPHQIPVPAGYEPILEDLKLKLKSVEETQEEIVVIDQPIYDQRRAYEESVLAKQAGLPTEHSVKKGESLWLIAGYPEIYGNPLEWPNIYQANRDRILDPNLIYPEQALRIPRGMNQIRLDQPVDQETAPRHPPLELAAPIK